MAVPLGTASVAERHSHNMFLHHRVVTAAGGGFDNGLGQGPYRYWKLDIYKWVNYGGLYNADTQDVSTTSVRVAEFELISAGPTENPTVNATGYTTGSLVVTDDGDDDGTRLQWHALDGNDSDGNRWISNALNQRHKLQFDLGSGNQITPTSYTIAPDGAVSFSSQGYYLVGWELWGSNTGAFGGEEELVDKKDWVGYSRWSGWANNTPRTFNLNLTATASEHRYWRIKDITVPAATVNPRGLRYKAGGTEYQLDGGNYATTLPSVNYLSNLFDGSATEPRWTDTVIENAAFYLMLDLGEGNRRNIDAIQLQGGGTSTDYFQGFTLQYSDNGTDWTTAFTKSGLTWPGAGVWSSDYTA